MYIVCSNICRRLATGRWFSPGPPVYSNKTGLYMYFITMHESISSNINKSKDFRCLTYAIVYDMCMGYGCLTPLAMLFHIQMYINKKQQLKRKAW
jgi:hypothetical protein